MSEQTRESISITLSPAQIDEVVRAASRGSAPSISTLVAGSLAETRKRAGKGHAGDTRASARGANGADRANGTGRSGTADDAPERGYLPSDTDDPRLSRSLLRGLSLLAGFGPDGAERGIVELADELGMSPSTAHRYALTLVELGLLERCPRTRKYRLPDV